jgi:cell division transport system ATP-binding protein
MNQPVLFLRNANIYQDKSLILQDINIEVNKGEFIYLIGKTGSGKSSFMKTLYADLPLIEGQGSIVDFDLAKLKEKNIPYLRRKIGKTVMKSNSRLMKFLIRLV